MRLAIVTALALVSGVARADEPIELHEGLTRESTSEPLLHLDTTLRSFTEGFDADEKTERFDFAIGPNTRARLEANAWTNPLFGGEGWGSTLSLVHDFKWFQVGLYGGYQRMDSQLAHGGYRVVGLSIAKTFRLSKWMTAWLSLGVAQRTWLGKNGPPPGEANDTTVMLNLGTTFR